MRIELKVIPGARKNLYKQEGDGTKVYLTAPPVDGKANEALIKFLAEHFCVKVGRITLLKGLKSRHKVVNIEGL
jgi:uncharacterized protein